MPTIVGNPTSQGEIWTGDFQSGDCRQYPTLISQNASKVHGIWQDPSRLTIKNDTPPPGLKNYANLSCHNTDAGGPRCQLQSPNFAFPGQVFEFAWWCRMNYVPTVGSNHFLMTEIYNSPFFNSPVLDWNIDNAGNYQFAGAPVIGGVSTVEIYWTTPLILNTWMKNVCRMKVSTDPTIGWFEFYFANDGTDNVVQQTLAFNGSNYLRVPSQTQDYHSDTGQVLAAGAMAIYPDCYTNSTDPVSNVDHAGYRAATLPAGY